MKKIREHKKRFIRNQKRAKRRSAKQRASRKVSPGTFGSRLPLYSNPAENNIITVTAPKILSLTENPEGTVKFIQAVIRADRPKCDIALNLDEVEEVTLDAVLLLVSQIKGRVIHRCRSIGGNQPKNAKVREFLFRSGFYSHVSNPPASYKEELTNGYMKRREGDRVREDFAQELIHYANQRLSGETHQPNKGIYRVLIECMANTRDHASIGRQKRESWWLAVYHDESKAKIYFAFLDNGVGLFESTKIKGFLNSVGSMIGTYNRADLLLDMLDGKTESRTGLHYRGKGLPAIYKAMERGFFSNLKIVSNNVFMDATSRKGQILKSSFRGTSYTWEISA